jgi:hypothetical protein
VEMERADADRAYGEFVERAWDHHLRVARLLTGDPHRAFERRGRGRCGVTTHPEGDQVTAPRV